jgi:predicted component of type VI protein secretion system
MAVGHLKIFFGEEQEDKVFVLEQGKTYRIGRAKDADIRLKDIKVSRDHAMVRAENDQYYVEDLGSRNGTYVNGEKTSGRMEIKDGDQIRLGFSVLQFFLADRGSHVVESPAEVKKCALCAKDISEADLIAGRAEEVDGKQYCPECMAKMQDLFDEGGKQPELDAPPPPEPAAPAPASAPASSPGDAEPEMPEPPPPSDGMDLDLADLIDEGSEKDLDLLPDRDEEHLT